MSAQPPDPGALPMVDDALRKWFGGRMTADDHVQEHRDEADNNNWEFVGPKPTKKSTKKKNYGPKRTRMAQTCEEKLASLVPHLVKGHKAAMALFEELTAAITNAIIAFDEYHTPAYHQQKRCSHCSEEGQAEPKGELKERQEVKNDRHENVARIVGQFVAEVIDGALSSIHSGWKAFDEYHTPKPSVRKRRRQQTTTCRLARMSGTCSDDGEEVVYQPPSPTAGEGRKKEPLTIVVFSKATPVSSKEDGLNELDLQAEYDVVPANGKKEDDVGSEEGKEPKEAEFVSVEKKEEEKSDSSSSDIGFVVMAAEDEKAAGSDDMHDDWKEDQQQEEEEEDVDEWCLVDEE